jgi:methionyl-tRNA synthetase
MLGYTSEYRPSISDAAKTEMLVPGTQLQPLENIFPRLVAPKEDKIEASKPAPPGLPEGLVTIDDFFKSRLVVAEVLACEAVPEATKLLKLQIAIGDEKRQIVAGIAEFYKPDAMIGKKIVVVSNLVPATIRGIESNGMLLAAKKGKELKLVTVDGDIPSGAKVG